MTYFRILGMQLMDCRLKAHFDQPNNHKPPKTVVLQLCEHFRLLGPKKMTGGNVLNRPKTVSASVLVVECGYSLLLCDGTNSHDLRARVAVFVKIRRSLILLF